MILSAHQPSYLPWLGYLDKMAKADVFVVMDDLQYEKENFQNRNRVKLNNGAGWLTVPLERDLKAHAAGSKVMIYACGPEPMLAAVARVAAAYSTPAQVSVERVMGCGMGGCYSCVIPVRTGGRPHYVRSCLAGPVFRAEEIEWH